MINDYQAASPAEIDAVLHEQGYKEAVARNRVSTYSDRLRDHQAAVEGRKSRYGQLLPYQVERYEEDIAKFEAEAEAARKAQEPGEAEYARRGGWTRGFLVQGPNGHLHKSMNCSTCNNGDQPTTFVWLTEYSGMDEAELVEKAGERACTTCHPSAPAGTLARESQLRPDVEARAAKAARDAEKAEKAAAKAAKAIAMPDGSPLRERYGVIRTVVSAWRNAVAARADQLWYSASHPSNGEWQRLIEDCTVALAHKLGKPVEEIAAEIEKKAQAKHKRDSK